MANPKNLNFQNNCLPINYVPLYRGTLIGEENITESLPVWHEFLSTDSMFCQALVGCGYLTREQMAHAAQRFRLGRSSDGGVIFWQIDETARTRDGKIMFYRSDCHRDKSPGKHPSWYLARLKAACGFTGELPVERCLFGLHQLPLARKYGRPVAVVESEKTAVIMSELKPGCVWMATGGQGNLSERLLSPLREQRVVLFPDTDPDGQTYRRWRDVAREASADFLYPIYVSTLLEDEATAEQKQQKIDIIDYLFPLTPKKQAL